MSFSKILCGLLITCSILFLGLQSVNQEFNAFGVKSLGMLLLLSFYCVSVSQKNRLFSLFLVIYTFADIYNYVTYDFFPAEGITYDVHYLVGNFLYILAYLLLIFRILELMNFKDAWRKFPYQLVLLFALDVFVVWVLIDLVRSTLVTDYAYITELLYNLTVMILVSLALINYMQNDTKKSMNLLIGTICILFSEVIQIAYYYLSSLDKTLNIAYSVFLVLAFVFFFIQSKLPSKHFLVRSSS